MPTERRQVAIMAVASTLGAIGALGGFLLVSRSGRDPLVAVLIRGGGLLIAGGYFWSMRPVVSIARRCFHAVIVGVLALGWLAAVVEYLGDRS